MASSLFFFTKHLGKDLKLLRGKYTFMHPTLVDAWPLLLLKGVQYALVHVEASGLKPRSGI